MSMYTVNDGVLMPTSHDLTRSFHRSLPLGTYSIGLTPAGYHLQPQDSFVLPPKIYGSTPRHAERIMSTYADRPRSTGVLLEGEKGSGKTLLSTMISLEGLKRGMSTLIVNAPYHGESFNAFVQSIDEPIILLFDEFEKVYKQDDWQSGLLTLFDGTAMARLLSVFTINNASKVSSYLRNRPGRIFYAVEYKTLEEDFIIQYCEDVLNDKSHIESILAITSLFNKFNFDMLKALVEEMNRYGEGPKAALRLLNIKPDFTVQQYYDCTYSSKGQQHPSDHTDTLAVNGHPLNNEEGYEVEFFNVRRYEYDSRNKDHRRWTIDFDPDHMVHADARRGVFEFENQEHRMILTKRKNKTSYWDNIRSGDY